MSIAQYSFLSWIRQGISTKIQRADQPDLPSRVEMTVKLNARATGTQSKQNDEAPIEKRLRLYGPGDVTGFDPRIVVRTDPRPNVGDFEPNYFPAIEFAEPDFPWRFTPAKAPADDHLRPWLCLIVLKEEELEKSGDSFVVHDPNTPLPHITVKDTSKSLPDLTQSWAWVHVHLFDEIDEFSEEEKEALREYLRMRGKPEVVISAIIRQKEMEFAQSQKQKLMTLWRDAPELFVSRLLCPRYLYPGTAYHAFVVPTFDLGRSVGLGESIDPNHSSIKPAWDVTAQARIVLPVYYYWSFRTGLRGDFEYLVRLLEPRPVDNRVGKRDMDVSEPGLNVRQVDHGTQDDPLRHALGLEGALIPAEGFQRTPWKIPNYFQDDLANKVLNLPARLLQADAKGEPIVVPPISGCWHALQPTVDEKVTKPEGNTTINKGWINQLNLDPRCRAAAAFGTSVVQEQQEDLMASAWKQVGAIEEANQKLREAQLARVVSQRIKEKHFDRLPLDAFFSVTSPVQRRIIVPDPQDPRIQKTVGQTLRESLITRAATSPTFRRVSSAAGVMRRSDKTTRFFKPNSFLTNLNAKKFSAEGTKTEAGVKNIQNLDGIHAKYQVPIDVNQLLGKIPDTGEPGSFKKVSSDMWGEVQPDPAKASPSDVKMDHLAGRILNGLNPRETVFAHVKSRLKLEGIKIKDTLNTIMAFPQFPQPMYEPLRDLSQDYFLPGIEFISQNTITLLKTNQRFIEAYMMGLNHEMGKELLWREYPTDQRGSYFRQFWDVRGSISAAATDKWQVYGEENEYLKDITRINEWNKDSDLGSHKQAVPDNHQPGLVLLVRGDLLKKYPTAIIYAVKAKKQNDGTRTMVDGTEKFPVFRGTCPPDITFFGFYDLTPEAARGDNNNPAGWFLVIQEQPSEPRFGMDVANGKELETWNDLAWSHLKRWKNGENNNGNNGEGNFESENKYIDLVADRPDIQPPNQDDWGKNSAKQAFITLQRPVRIAIHASEMLPPVKK